MWRCGEDSQGASAHTLELSTAHDVDRVLENRLLCQRLGAHVYIILHVSTQTIANMSLVHFQTSVHKWREGMQEAHTQAQLTYIRGKAEFIVELFLKGFGTLKQII